ncbi:MAG: VanZ family protein [Gaiella sp.]
MLAHALRAFRAPGLAAWLLALGWAAVIFGFSSVPSLGSGLGTWDLVLRKLAHVAEYAALGLLLLRACGAIGWAWTLGVAYAATDELHQSFVEGRRGVPLDVAIDAVGVALGIVALILFRASPHRGGRP